jgi:hypothetical protein
MPLEIATSINSLDSAWPLSSDPANQGDDHLRLIKSVLKAQFPGSSGTGFSTPITATETEINYLSGVTGNLQGQINAIAGGDTSEFAAGTKLFFYQAAAPSGWVQDTAYSDHMLRCVASGGGSSGGSDSPILNSKVPLHTHAFSATSSGQSSNHTHGYEAPNIVAAYAFGGLNGCNGPVSKTTSGVSGDHTHAVSGTTNSNTSGSNWTPKYVSVILCTKS